MLKILALNSGSNSLKFEVAEIDPAQPVESHFGRILVSGAYDNIGKPEAKFTLFDGKRERHQEAQDIPNYTHAANLLLDWIARGEARPQGIDNLNSIDAIGHRIVHGGHLFQAPARIDDGVIRKIEELEDLAPLHNASAVEVIRATQKRIPQSTPMVAVFDTLFHRTIPEVAAHYPFPRDLSERHHIRRYGFHGISHRYMMLRYGQLTAQPHPDPDPPKQPNLITLHLEGGSSATAIRNGQSIDTSMGFTPLEGLMMGTRTGDIDPALVFYLMRKENLDPRAIESFLNEKCGLLGVSGRSADTRELTQHLDDPNVELALAMFCYRVRKYIGAYLAALGRVDAIIFGGGIGENTPTVRERICTGLQNLGIFLDPERNADLIDKEGTFHSPDSQIQLWMIPTEEALMVAHEAAHLLGS